MRINLQGTWKGFIQSTWVHPSGEQLEPIPVIVTIVQNEVRTSCTMRTNEMCSKSENEKLFVDNDTGIPKLVYQYRSVPDPSVKARSAIHQGTMDFEYIENPERKLVGTYYTDRKTDGKIELTFWKEALVHQFPDSAQMHPAKQQDIYLAGKESLKKSQGEFPMKVLYAGVSPEDEDALRIDKELREIRQRIRLSHNRESFELYTEFASTTLDLQQAMLDHAPNVLHFSGHADIDGIYLEDVQGKGVLVPNKGLLQLMKFHQDSLKCVILNACYTELLAAEISNLDLVVIGMNDKISDIDAIRFSKGFYTALGAGKSFESAFESGKISLSLDGSKGAETPTLKLPPSKELE